MGGAYTAVQYLIVDYAEGLSYKRSPNVDSGRMYVGYRKSKKDEKKDRESLISDNEVGGLIETGARILPNMTGALVLHCTW